MKKLIAEEIKFEDEEGKYREEHVEDDIANTGNAHCL